MSQPALQTILRAAACGTLLGTACSSGALPPPTPVVAQVVVPVQSGGEAHEQSALEFRCDEHARSETTRVEFRVQSANHDGSISTETRAVYTITAHTEREHRVDRAEIVLESLTTDAHERAQSAWTLGLDAGWISLRRPFEITREGSTWCFVSACDDATRHEFAGAIGDTAELVALPELIEQLTRVTDTTTLRLPPVLVKRMGVGSIDPALLPSVAHRRGVDFPALFVVERGAASDDEATDEDRVAGTEPLARAELLVSRGCRLQALKVELASMRMTPEGSGGTHRFSWSFDPLP